MKFLIVFALAFATVSAKDLYSRSMEAPVLENEGRITNGKNATTGEFKYQVGLTLRKDNSNEWCGGSMIDKNWILTAAHCTVRASSAKVFLGTTKRKVAEKVYNVSKDDITVHPEFKPANHENDISLIQIPTTSESSTIGIIKIASNGDRHIGDSVVVSGWGYLSDTANGLPYNLQYGILKVSPNSLCSIYGSNFCDRTSICVATPNEVSVCHGDSGGPLVLEEQKLQIGVVSYGNKIGCRKGPLVFTRVGIYRFWIESLTGITGYENNTTDQSKYID